MDQFTAPRGFTARKSLTQGLGGWYSANEVTFDAGSFLRAMDDALQSSLTAVHASPGNNGIFSTGGLSTATDGALVSIVGFPQWNSKELTDLAKKLGDSAALARVWCKCGESFTDHVSGSYAFVIFNPENQCLRIGIDRLGRFPLYYANTKNGIVFGSSASVVLAHPEVSRKITAQGIFSYLYFHMIPSPDSIYRGLKKLPAAHMLTCQKGQLSVKRYWTPTFDENGTISFEKLGKSLHDNLRGSVSRVMDSGQHTGAFLSGGLDSSTVTGVFAELSDSKVDAYSIGFSAPGYDEMEYARITAKHFGVNLHEYYVTPEDVVDALPTIAISYDEPFGNSSALPAWFCARAAAQDGVTRLLAGDGGDEIFAGNERYAKQTIFEQWLRLPQKLRAGLIEPVVNIMPTSLPLIPKARSFLDQANTPLPDRLQNYNFLHRHDYNTLFTNEFLSEIETNAPLELLQDVYGVHDNASTLNRMLYLDWQITLADNDIRKVSHMGAMAGVEILYPMLDDQLVDFSCKVPSAWKMKRNNLRHFYKSSLTGWLPNETINKKKQGFGLPFGVWMQEHKPLRDLAHENLISLKSRNILRPEFIDNLIQLHRDGHAAYYGELIWILTVLELWLGAYD